MLEQITIQGFKSLNLVESLDLPRLTVLFGPNAAGKSNFLDAVQALSRIGTSRTLSDALQDPIRGYPVEAFTFPAGGLTALLDQSSADFTLDAILKVEKERYQYRAGVQIEPRSGNVFLADEYLAHLTSAGTSKGGPLIERVEEQFHIRRRGKAARPRTEPTGHNYSLLADPRLGGAEYRGIERCRNELSGWRTYYLDPRIAMRRTVPPANVDDIGVLGENIAPFLYRLKEEKEHQKHFQAVVRTLRTLIPSVEGVSVDLDTRRGTLDIVVRQNGVDYSSRIISEGTLARACAMHHRSQSMGRIAGSLRRARKRCPSTAAGVDCRPALFARAGPGATIDRDHPFGPVLRRHAQEGAGENLRTSACFV